MGKAGLRKGQGCSDSETLQQQPGEFINITWPPPPPRSLEQVPEPKNHKVIDVPGLRAPCLPAYLLWPSEKEPQAG